jgi:hypothetical protein
MSVLLVALALLFAVWLFIGITTAHNYPCSDKITQSYLCCGMNGDGNTDHGNCWTFKP